jgi:hypothetical protein
MWDFLKDEVITDPAVQIGVAFLIVGVILLLVATLLSVFS